MNQKYRFTEQGLEVLNDRGCICVRSNTISASQLAKENLVETMQKDLNGKKNQLFSLQFFLNDSKGLCKLWRRLTIGCLVGMLIFAGVSLAWVSSLTPLAFLVPTLPTFGWIAEHRHQRKVAQELSLQEEEYAVLEKMLMEEQEENVRTQTSVATITEEFQTVPTDPNLSIYQDFFRSYDFYQQHRSALKHAVSLGTLDEYCQKHFTEENYSTLTSIVSLGSNPDFLAKGYAYCKQMKHENKRL